MVSVRLGRVLAICAVAWTTFGLQGCHKNESFAKFQMLSCPIQNPCELDFDPTDPHLKHHVMIVNGSKHNSPQSSVKWCYNGTTAVFHVSFFDDSPLDPHVSLDSSLDNKNKNCIGPINVVVYSQSGAGADGFKYKLTVPGFTAIDPHIIVVGGGT